MPTPTNSGRICGRCGAEYAVVDANECPLCGGILDEPPERSGHENFELKLSFARLSCGVCGQSTVVRRDLVCTSCGSPLPTDSADQHVRQRRDTFKGGVRRLQSSASRARLTHPVFARRGKSFTIDTYLESVMSPTLAYIPRVLADLKSEAAGASWLDDKDSVARFGRIRLQIESAIERVQMLASQVPPMEMRSGHHLLTRATGELVAGHIELLSAVIAPDLPAAVECQKNGQRLLDSAAVIAHQLAGLVDKVKRIRQGNGWMSGAVLDYAAIAWDAVDNEPTTVADAAGRVRQQLAGVPGVAELDDAHALMLLPALVASVTVVDPVLTRERVELARNVLNRADQEAPGWVADSDELVRRIRASLRATSDQAQRLGAAPVDPQYRLINAMLLVDVYKSLLEGPVRDLGAIVVIARRAIRGLGNATYRPDTARGVQSGDVVQELATLGISWAASAQMLIRNAGAHGGVEVLDSGISLRQERIEDGIVVDVKDEVVTDSQFGEEFACLLETAFALQLTVVPWLFAHKSDGLRRARNSAPPDWELEAGVRLLAGLRGLREVAILRRGSSVAVEAKTAPGVDVRDVAIPSLLPLLFHSWPAAERATLSIDSRESVSFARNQVVGWDTDFAQGRSVAVGLVARRWIGDCGDPAAERADLLYVCRPLIAAIGAAIVDLGAERHSVRGPLLAQARLAKIYARVRAAELPGGHSPLIDDLRNLLLDALRATQDMRKALLRRDQSRSLRSAQAIADVITRLAGIGETVEADLSRTA